MCINGFLFVCKSYMNMHCATEQTAQCHKHSSMHCATEQTAQCHKHSNMHCATEQTASATNKHSNYQHQFSATRKCMQGALKCLCVNCYRTGQKERKWKDLKRGGITCPWSLPEKTNNNKLVKFFSKTWTNMLECMNVILLQCNHQHVLCGQNMSILSSYVVTLCIRCLVCCLYTVNENAIDNTPNTWSKHVLHKKKEHRSSDTKYSFTLYLIIHYRQFYFNYIPTVLKLQPNSNHFNNCKHNNSCNHMR
jgi:hypothetical protein